MSFPPLDDLEKDILRESLNLGVGRAAAILSELLGHEVELHLPQLELLPKRTAVELLSDQFDTISWAVRQDFHRHGDPAAMSGHIFLFLRDGQGPLPVSRFTAALGADGMALPDDEIIHEIGNILLNACLSGLADLLEMELAGELPTVHQSALRPLLLGLVRHGNAQLGIERRRPEEDQDPVIHLQLRFDTPCATLMGTMMIFLDLITIPRLKEELARIAARFG